MKVRILAAVAALALGTAITGGAAQAATYMLTVDGCSGSGCLGSSTNVGSVTVTQDTSLTGVLDFSVNLNSGVVFNSSGNSPTHHALAFDLIGNATTLAGLQFVNAVTDFSLSTTGGSESPFGSFTDVINYTGDAAQGSAPSTLSFKLQDNLNNLTLASLGFTAYTPQGSNTSENIVLASDVFSNGNTGNVGALSKAAVPEPATWGLMIAGFGAIGAAMRQQRRRALTLA